MMECKFYTDAPILITGGPDLGVLTPDERHLYKTVWNRARKRFPGKNYTLEYSHARATEKVDAVYGTNYAASLKVSSQGVLEWEQNLQITREESRVRREAYERLSEEDKRTIRLETQRNNEHLRNLREQHRSQPQKVPQTSAEAFNQW